MTLIVEVPVALSIFESGGNRRIGSSDDGYGAQRARGMSVLIAVGCMDWLTDIDERQSVMGTVATAIWMHL